MSTVNFNISVISSIPAGQGHICEQFIGDGQKHTFDLCEVPSTIHDMTARVSSPPHSTVLVIGNLGLETFAGGYNALVDRVGKRTYLEHALHKGELLLVEYPFDDSNRSLLWLPPRIHRPEPGTFQAGSPGIIKIGAILLPPCVKTSPSTMPCACGSCSKSSPTWRFGMASGQYSTTMRGSIASASTVTSPGGDSKRQAWLQRRR